MYDSNQQVPFPQETILRFPQVATITGLSRATVFRLERDGEFPSRVHIGKRGVGWKSSEIAAWLDSCPRCELKAI
jgi:prophage regulatory protein